MSLIQYTFVIWMVIAEIAVSHQDTQEILVYSVGTEIRKYDLRTRQDQVFIKNLKYRPVGVAVSADSNSIYWSNINSDKKAIMRSTLHGHNTEVIVDTGLFAPEILTVDWVTGNIYFIDTYKKQIGVCTENGLICTILLNSTVLDRPGGLVLNPEDGEMFWSDYGKIPSIWRAGMDGNGAKIIVEKNVGWPKDLTIDYSKKLLYWIDSKFEKIQYASLDGKTNQQKIISLEGKDLRSLAIFDDKVFWSDWSTNRIQWYKEQNLRSIVFRTSGLIYDMDISHPLLKPSLPNPCTEHRCQEICLLALDRRYTCACKFGRVLNPDLHTCSPKIDPSHLVITAGNKILHYHEEPLGQDRINEHLMPISMTRIIYDCKSRNFFGDDQFTNALYSLDPVNNEIRLITAPVYSQYLGGMDIHHKTNIISWSITSIRRIDQISLNNDAKTNYTFEDVPLDILSVPKCTRSLIVFKSDTTGLRIDWLTLKNPQRARTIIPKLIGPKISLAYDKHSQRVYFADEGTGNIESFAMNSDCLHRCTDCNIDRRLVLRSGVGKPVSLAVSNHKLFWITRGSNILQWVDLNDEYRDIKSKILPTQNDVGIINIIAVDNIAV